jgi:hypothetical protein
MSLISLLLVFKDKESKQLNKLTNVPLFVLIFVRHHITHIRAIRQYHFQRGIRLSSFVPVSLSLLLVVAE